MVTKASKQNATSFKTLWIRFDTDSSDKHQLFFKEHSVRNQEPEYPRNRTLFVLNIPPYVTVDCLNNAFTNLCGNVQSVTLSNTKGFKTAYIVFKKESSLDKAMELSKDFVITLKNEKNICLTGVKKWCKEYNDTLYDEQLMKKDIEEYIDLYDKRVQDRIAQEKAADESNNGWVTVTGKKKRGQFAPSRKESTIGKVQQKEEQRKKKKQLLNFYTFQIRESKKQNLAELRKKFELDKKRLQELKQKRTFKPF
ncbi:PREDICTED: ribosomal RNA-processing protein 7 homolog A [Cyphomyrmex costatus]|uniref:Ribosomal RNA-processing protein 7 like protein A n=1 Tax=Cyphomyrmex costatus TaxID=456900 RepID=A0A195D6G0_9HYME|nr:PREDICTED: ribosomal RNA-processing protein 7 homolog A [Cyphomyrmex costatus]XP_018394379.1 PREDICTED: ribosomal RNA-processing protein 7 homolog A [Cyphomyrmex costatus]KYN08485.1 Ribosomal RNA-processing protein 7 like protein A [Cyphomyrmex costatus]